MEFSMPCSWITSVLCGFAAFDVCKDWKKALEDIISLGCTRVLTSGQESSALEGLATIELMVQQVRYTLLSLRDSSNSKYRNKQTDDTGELGYDRLNRTRKIGPSYAKSVVYIWRILDMHQTGTKHIVRHMQKIHRTVVRHIQVHLYSVLLCYIYISEIWKKTLDVLENQKCWFCSHITRYYIACFENWTFSFSDSSLTVSLKY